MATTPDYEEAPGMLKINKDLGWALEDELREKCRVLVNSNALSLIIDLTPANHVCSANLVIFAYAGALATKNKKSLKLLISKRVARSFQLAGFDEFLDLRVV
jgi:anti-anti-sigma regulatory factor